MGLLDKAVNILRGGLSPTWSRFCADRSGLLSTSQADRLDTPGNGAAVGDHDERCDTPRFKSLQGALIEGRPTPRLGSLPLRSSKTERQDASIKKKNIFVRNGPTWR